MNPVDTVAVLNRLLAILHRSLAMYLHEAEPWHRRGNEKGAAVLQNMCHVQQELVGRIAELILQRDGQPEPGGYPREFSDANWHYVDVRYLLHPLLAHQRRDVQRIEQCVSELAADREARALAEEALGTARAHLESLEELVSNGA